MTYTYRRVATWFVAGLASSLLSVTDPGVAHAMFVPVVPTLASPVSLLTADAPDPVLYADRLVRAWGRGDRLGTAALGTPEVVAALFGYANPGGRYWVRGYFQGAAGTQFVTYRDPFRGVTVTVGVDMVSASRSHLVYRVEFSGPAVSVSSAEYADLAVRAWGRGDRDATARYSTEAVTGRLFSFAAPGGGRWRRTGATGAAGTTYVTFHNDAHGGDLVLAVSNGGQWQGQGHSVYDARFSR